MSRVGKNPVKVPSGVTVEVKGQAVAVKGKLGALNLMAPPEVEVKVDGDKVVVAPRDLSIRSRTLWGTTRANINNIVKGVSAGFSKVLEIEGVGFRAAIAGKDAVLQLGFSHEIKYRIPEGITIKADKPTQLTISGFDAQKVGQVAAEIRGMKKPEPYKGKGIRYQGEYILRKEGKKK